MFLLGYIDFKIFDMFLMRLMFSKEIVILIDNCNSMYLIYQGNYLIR